MTCSTLTGSSACLFVILVIVSYSFMQRCMRSFAIYRTEKIFNDSSSGMEMGAFHRMQDASGRALRQGAIALAAGAWALTIIT